MLDGGGLICVVRDITERKRSEEKINALLAEKELILKEVHHRIRNNMNTIVCFLHLQSAALKDPSAIAALNDAENRVYSMMVLYEKLYQSVSFNDVSVKDYFPVLVDQIIGNFPAPGMGFKMYAPCSPSLINLSLFFSRSTENFS